MRFFASPDSAASWADLAQAFALSNPVAAFAAVVIACGLFAAWASKAL